MNMSLVSFNAVQAASASAQSQPAASAELLASIKAVNAFLAARRALPASFEPPVILVPDYTSWTDAALAARLQDPAFNKLLKGPIQAEQERRRVEAGKTLAAARAVLRAPHQPVREILADGPSLTDSQIQALQQEFKTLSDGAARKEEIRRILQAQGITLVGDHYHIAVT